MYIHSLILIDLLKSSSRAGWGTAGADAEAQRPLWGAGSMRPIRPPYEGNSVVHAVGLRDVTQTGPH